MAEEGMKQIVKEFSPEMFFAGLKGMVQTGEYESIEFRIICHKKRPEPEEKKDEHGT